MFPRVSILLVAICTACATPPAVTPTALLSPITVEQARAKLRKISTNKIQLWVVSHIRAHQHKLADGTIDEDRLIRGALMDADAIVQGGGDAIVLINSRAKMPVYERVIAAVRNRYPYFPLAISALKYGPKNLTEGFRLAKRFNAQVVWCEVVPGEPFEYEENNNKYVKGTTTERNFALKVQNEVKENAMHVAGVHMKYTRPLNDLTFADAVTASLGSVDGINITGPKTGVRAEIDRIKAAHKAAGGYPLGLASGVSTQNITPVIPFIDYAIVGTSLKENHDSLRTSREKVWRLRRLLDVLGGGTVGAAAPKTMQEMHADDHEHHDHTHHD